MENRLRSWPRGWPSSTPWCGKRAPASWPPGALGADDRPDGVACAERRGGGGGAELWGLALLWRGGGGGLGVGGWGAGHVLSTKKVHETSGDP